jgi:hypothetical protein
MDRPEDYKYDANTKIVHAYSYAEISVKKIHGFFDKLIHDDAVADKSIEVVHFDRVDNFLFSSDEASGVLASLTCLIDEKDLQATVFVGKGDLRYGIAHMLQIMYEMHDPNYTTFVVRNDKELHRAIYKVAG